MTCAPPRGKGGELESFLQERWSPGSGRQVMPAAAAAPRLLFRQEDGRAMRFYVRPGPAKAELTPLIQPRGGQLCRLQEPGALLLVRPGEVPPGAQGDFISTRYITDCVAQDERLPLERYRLKPETAAPAPAAGRSPVSGRLPFTEAEDRAILLSVHGTKGGLAAVAGTALWKDLARARVIPHSWQSMRDRYLKQLRSRAGRCLLAPSPDQRADGGVASQNEQVMDVLQEEDERHTAEGPKAPSIFQLANQEFEGNEWESKSASPSGDMLLKHPEPRTSEEASVSPNVQAVEMLSSEDSDVPQSLREDQPVEPSSEQVPVAIEDMTCLMEEFGVDLATVTQAFLKTSGEVTAVVRCLQTGPHSEGCPPLWTRQDDLDLLTGDDLLRSKLIAKYGEENVNRRVAFRKN